MKKPIRCNKAIQQLDQVIQQNASSSEEIASTSEELTSQAEQLQETIGFFKIEGGRSTRGERRGAVVALKPAAKKIVQAKSTRLNTGTAGATLQMHDTDEAFERY